MKYAKLTDEESSALSLLTLRSAISAAKLAFMTGIYSKVHQLKKVPHC
jgi:hypothetical protein